MGQSKSDTPYNFLRNGFTATSHFAGLRQTLLESRREIRMVAGLQRLMSATVDLLCIARFSQNQSLSLFCPEEATLHVSTIFPHSTLTLFLLYFFSSCEVRTHHFSTTFLRCWMLLQITICFIPWTCSISQACEPLECWTETFCSTVS